MSRLEGRRATVAGAGSGITQATATRLSQQETRIALADMDDAAAGNVAR